MTTTAFETNYTHARRNFPQLWKRVASKRQTVIIRKRGSESLAILPESELNSIMETAHLRSSPRNDMRLQAALESALNQEGTPQSVESLAKGVGLGEKA